MISSLLEKFEQVLFFHWLAPVLGLCAVVIVFHIFRKRRIITLKERGEYSRYREQSISFIGGIVFVLSLIIVMPIDGELRGQLLSLLGIVISAALALSSTTVMGNLLAGIMLRVVDSFNIGDFIKHGGQLGRVSDIGLLHIEMQTEDSDLLTISNLVLVSQAYTVIRAKGTILKAEVSLGYDVHRRDVERALLRAVEAAELSDGFVEVAKLGDFSINYIVHAHLSDTRKLVVSRSRLRAAMIDCLHEDGIEIVSPNFMNQRQLEANKKIIANTSQHHQEDDNAVAIDNVLFSKAARAEFVIKVEKRLLSVKEKIVQLEGELSKADKEQQQEIIDKLERAKRREAQLQFLIDDEQDKAIS